MRTGIFISAVSHIVLVAFVLLGTPKLFDTVPLQTIEVDLVRAQEAEPEPPQEPEKKPPEKSPDWNPLPEASAAQAKPAAPEAATPPSRAKQPTTTQQQARAPQQPADPPRQQQPQQQQQPPDPPAQSPQQPWIFDPVNIPALMNIPNSPSGFDSEATATADLSTDQRTAFKNHLKKCWKLPEGLSPAQTTRVTLRVFLKRDGGLAAEPMLIEASASREGPLLMQAALRSVKDCQPFGFLPPDKYREWKTLDVSFSPKEMAGG